MSDAPKETPVAPSSTAASSSSTNGTSGTLTPGVHPLPESSPPPTSGVGMEFAPPSGPAGGELPPEMLSLLRSLRAEAQDLRRVLELLQSGSATLASQTSYLNKTKQDLDVIQTKLAADQSGHDTVHHLLNLLEQMNGNPLLPPPAEPLAAQEQTNAIVLLLANIQRIELLVGLLTARDRLNDWLKDARPGYYVPFHLVFQDEIPHVDDRQIVLNHLAWNPKAVKNGIVDVTNGLIFRYSEDENARLRSLGWLALAILVSVVIIVGASRLPLALPEMPQATDGERATIFLLGWLAVVVGVITHIGVENAKREKVTQLPTVLAVSDLRETIDARLGQIIWKLVLVLIGFFAVAFAMDPTVNLVSAFLVGYSLDSLVGVFGASIEIKVKAVQDRLRAT